MAVGMNSLGATEAKLKLKSNDQTGQLFEIFVLSYLCAWNQCCCVSDSF